MIYTVRDRLFGLDPGTYQGEARATAPTRALLVRSTPLREHHAPVRANAVCPACLTPFEVGQHTTQITLGPGEDPEQQLKALHAEWYHAKAILVHWSCATGQADA